MIGTAPSAFLAWLQRSSRYLDLLVVLGASICLALALWVPTAPPPFTQLYRQLHPLETGAIGSYAWSQPEFKLSLPLEQTARHALLRQRMTAGATPDTARPFTVSAGATTLAFRLHGGTPLRTYSYLLPVSASELRARFSIAPLSADQPNDERALGVLLLDTQVRLLDTQPLPGVPVLALVGVPLSLVLVALGWGLGPFRRPLMLLVALGLALFVAADRYTVLSTSSALASGLVMVAALGYLCRRLTQTAQTDVGSVLLWCLAAVIGPWTYLAAGLGANLGRQWLRQPQLAGLLLSLPVLAGALALVRPASRRLQVALAGLALGGVLGWGLFNLQFELTNFAFDFSAYYYGAQRVLNGQPLYEPARLAADPFVATYKYHPAFLVFVLPLAPTSLDTAILLWRSLGVSFIGASAALMIATQPAAFRWHLSVLAFVLGTNFAPIGQTLRLGQTDPLILFGMVAALLSFRRFPWLSAALWGGLGLIKIYPLFLLLPALLQRAWRWLFLVGSMLVLGGGAALAFGWQNQLVYWRTVVPLLSERNGRLTNQSLYGLIVRLFYPDSIGDAPTALANPAANLLLLALTASILGVTLWLLYRRRTALSPWTSASLLVCTLLLIMPVSWDHYETLLLLPLLLGAAHTLREPGRPTLLLLAAYALLAFGAYKNLWQNTSAPTSFGLLFASYRTLGLALLWGWWANVTFTAAPAAPSACRTFAQGAGIDV